MFANASSVAVHVAGLMLVIWVAPHQWWSDFRVQQGRTIVLQMSLPTFAAHEPPPPIQLAVDSPVQPQSNPAPRPVSLERQTIDRQVEVVPMGELEPTVAETAIVAESSLAQPQPAEARPAEAPPAEAQPKPPRVSRAPSAMALAAQQPVRVGADVDEPPAKLPTNQPPPYPVDALLAGIEGRVLLRVQVAATGLVDDVELHTSSGSASLDRAALAAVRRWRFRAARFAGQPIAHDVLVPVRFTIRRG